MRIDQLYGSLAHYRLIRKTYCYIHEMSESDLELLINLASLRYFTRLDFEDGVVSTSWDRHRIARFVKSGYIKQIYRHSGQPGDHSKYEVELSWKMKIQRIYKILFGDELIPETHLERCAKTSKAKHLLKRVKQYNKIKRKL